MNNAERIIEAFTCYACHCSTDKPLVLFSNPPYPRT